MNNKIIIIKKKNTHQARMRPCIQTTGGNWGEEEERERERERDEHAGTVF
jgi:hypothetical protein